MTKEEKVQFIKKLTDSIRDELVARVDEMPEEWDGHELRELLAAKFDAERSNVMLHHARRRRRYYREFLARGFDRMKG